MAKFEAQKALYNISTTGTVKYGDHLLPMLSSEVKSFDIVFVQGQQSDPLRTWSVSKEEATKLWPKELLQEDFEKAAITFIRYESMQLQRDLTA
jgi:hypothetical protein